MAALLLLFKEGSAINTNSLRLIDISDVDRALIQDIVFPKQ